ncbi:MAG: tyrosine-type recombinase/integrase [bacterium]
MTENISVNLLIDYIEHLKSQEKSYNTIKNSIMALKLNFEFTNGYSVKHDFLRSIQRIKKLPEVLSIHEVKMILDSIGNVKHKAILSIIYSCGLTISECINLRISDINSTSMLIKIDQGIGKGMRYVALSQKLLVLLNLYYRDYKLEDNLFQGQTKEAYSARSIQKILKSALEKCEINKIITVRSLRHSYATHLVEEGIDIRIIQKILGQKDIRTTQIYSHISSANLSKITNPFDNF